MCGVVFTRCGRALLDEEQRKGACCRQGKSEKDDEHEDEQLGLLAHACSRLG